MVKGGLAQPALGKSSWYSPSYVQTGFLFSKGVCKVIGRGQNVNLGMGFFGRKYNYLISVLLGILEPSPFSKSRVFKSSLSLPFSLRTFKCLASFLCAFMLFASDGGTDYFLDTGYLFLADSANLDLRGKNIICLGDSITYGIGASPGHDYPSLLGRALGMKVINAGVDGDETEDVLKRLDQDVLSKNPGLVILLLGGNDYLDQVPLSESFKNLDQIIQRIQDAGATVVVIEIGASVLGKRVQKHWDKLVAEHQAPFVRTILRSYFFNPALKSDSLHPNDKGYEIITERILRVVKPLLKQSPQ